MSPAASSISGVATLTNCTIYGNQAATAGGIDNGGSLTATNDTIVANRSLTDTSGGIAHLRRQTGRRHVRWRHGPP